MLSPAPPTNKPASLAKLTQPTLARSVHMRERLFEMLDQARRMPIVWICAPAGAGKTTLIASYLNAKRVPSLWYQMDTGDNDPGAFFYYLGMAAQSVAVHGENRLPLLTPEYLGSLPVFSSNYFRELFVGLGVPSVLVLSPSSA